MPVKNYVMETLADTGKSKKELGYEAKIGLDEGLRLMSEHYL
jgi:nucleoside-diphosphate-sugar epimerase